LGGYLDAFFALIVSFFGQNDIPMITSYTLTTPDFDWQQLKQLAGEDTAFEAELLEMFLKDAEISLRDLELAIASRSCQSIEEIAHSLRGASANVGACALALVAHQLEHSARRGHLSEAYSLLQQLHTHCQSIRIHLKS
jgi:HPt (histidine-containing phosphotransfer) domain-containing protein